MFQNISTKMDEQKKIINRRRMQESVITQMKKEWLTIANYADKANISKQTVYNQIEAGKLETWEIEEWGLKLVKGVNLEEERRKKLAALFEHFKEEEIEQMLKNRKEK